MKRAADDRPFAPDEVESGRAVISITTHETVCRITIQGELDLVSAPDLANAYAAAQRHEPERIVVDLRACEFIDSRGLAALLGIHRCLADGELTIIAGSRPVRRALEVSGLDAVLPLVYA